VLPKSLRSKYVPSQFNRSDTISHASIARLSYERAQKLLLAGLGVFLASVVITLGIFFAMQANETQAARDNFNSMADNAATNTFKGGRDKNRNIRYAPALP
jgi:hypothetical protein